MSATTTTTAHNATKNLPQLLRFHPSEFQTHPGLHGAVRRSATAMSVVNHALKDLRSVGVTLALDAAPDPNKDYEEFWENVLRFSAAVTACRRAQLPFDAATDTSFLTEEQHLRRLGPIANYEVRGHSADQWVGHPGLTELMTGRSITRTTYHSPLSDIDDSGAHDRFDDEHPDLIAEIAALYRQGHRKVVIKGLATKSGVIVIDLTPTLGRPKGIHDALLSANEDFGWLLIRSEDQPGAFLVQPWLPMTHEYRLFVVDGKIVTGAGCIEEFTPLDRTPGATAFDVRTRQWRANGVAAERDTVSPVERSVSLVQTYVEFVTPFIDDLDDAENTVVIDVATVSDADGRTRPVIVELNDVPNAGLYAADVYRLYDKLLHASNRGYGNYPLHSSSGDHRPYGVIA